MSWVSIGWDKLTGGVRDYFTGDDFERQAKKAAEDFARQQLATIGARPEVQQGARNAIQLASPGAVLVTRQQMIWIGVAIVVALALWLALRKG